MIRRLPSSVGSGKIFWISLGIVLLCAIGALDYVTGPELSFAFFYLIPIAVTTLGAGWKYGALCAGAAANILLMVDLYNGPSYSDPLIPYWNATIRLFFFLLVVVIIRVNERLRIEIIMARRDYVTGVYNARYFHELAQREIVRSARYNHPITVVYIDVDNFKTINDLFGHLVGDKALATVASNLVNSLRQTDIVARVGGDEFAILMPETAADAVQTVLPKLQSSLLDEVRAHSWPITLSIGALTFNSTPISADQMLNMADKLMYTVKNSGKNDIRYAVHPGYDVSESPFDPQKLPLSK